MIPLAVLVTVLGLGAAEVTLPSYYFDGMVFQGDQGDTLIWGFTDNPDIEVLVEVACNGQQTLLRADPGSFKKASRKADGDIWEVTYPISQANGDECAITVTQARSGKYDKFKFGNFLVVWLLYNWC